MENVTIRVFLLDDHELVREGIRQLLETDDEITVVGEATTVAEARMRIPLALGRPARGRQWYRGLPRDAVRSA
jgi:hypothetical protein